MGWFVCFREDSLYMNAFLIDVWMSFCWFGMVFCYIIVVPKPLKEAICQQVMCL